MTLDERIHNAISRPLTIIKECLDNTRDGLMPNEWRMFLDLLRVEIEGQIEAANWLEQQETDE